MGERGFAPSGLVVAAVGFGLTRFTVTGAATDTTAEFLFAGFIPLVLGLGLSAAGVLLAVGGFDRLFVRTVAGWCLVGTASMAVLVVLTLLGTETGPDSMVTTRRRTSLSTFLIGGAVGGALTGLYAARNRQYRRNLDEQANRLVVLNRLLRDRVVNAATAISAHQEILEREHSEESVAVVGTQADEIVETVEQVKHLAETDGTGRVDLVACVETALSEARTTHPDAEFVVDAPESVVVPGTDRLSEAVRHLLVNAAEHSNSEHPRVAVSVETTQATATVRVSDDGPGLPARQQALLEDGNIAEYDDPTTGFGLNVVRLLAERFDGRLRTEVSDDGTTVELALPRPVDTDTAPATAPTRAGVRPSRATVAAGASLVAGLAMAGVMAALDGDLLAIGALYGIERPVVALVTHEFHSVVFGLTYAGVLTVLPVLSAREFTRRMVIGLVFGLTLWLFAAGVVMPAWLGLVGIDAPLPNLTGPSLAGHATWGLVVALGYCAGDRVLDTLDGGILPGGDVPTAPSGPGQRDSDS
jgi:two-component system OmpR family sensor kinase